MALAFTNVEVVTSPADASSYNSPLNSSPADDSWLVFDLISRVASGDPNIPTLSGGSLTYTQEATTAAGTTNRRLTRFVAQIVGASPGAYTLTADFAAQTQTLCFWHITNITGGDTSDIFVDGNSLTNSGTGTSGSVTLSAFASTDNRPLFAIVKGQATEAFTEGGVELADPAGTEGYRLSTSYYATAETVPSASWVTSAVWAAIAGEVKAAAAAGRHHLNLPLIGVG